MDEELTLRMLFSTRDTTEEQKVGPPITFSTKIIVK